MLKRLLIAAIASSAIGALLAYAIYKLPDATFVNKQLYASVKVADRIEVYKSGKYVGMIVMDDSAGVFFGDTQASADVLGTLIGFMSFVDSCKNPGTDRFL